LPLKECPWTSPKYCNSRHWTQLVICLPQYHLTAYPSLVHIITGFVELSTATSPNERWVLESYWPSTSTVISPERQKVKKAVSELAHNMIDLTEESLPTQNILNFLKIPGVIGKRDCLDSIKP